MRFATWEWAGPVTRGARGLIALVVIAILVYLVTPDLPAGFGAVPRLDLHQIGHTASEEAVGRVDAWPVEAADDGLTSDDVTMLGRAIVTPRFLSGDLGPVSASLVDDAGGPRVAAGAHVGSLPARRPGGPRIMLSLLQILRC